MKYRLIDLFSGAGGLSLGFIQTGGFESIYALDNNVWAVESYSSNFGNHAVTADIETVMESGSIPQADVVIGGPPCQGFSLLNRNRREDTRRSLWRPFLDTVSYSDASVFVIENVRELFRSPEFSEITEYAERLGFSIWADVLNAADYGTPQIRLRTFIVGYRKDRFETGFKPPEKTHGKPGNNEGLPEWKTVFDAISDLPPPEGTEIRDEPPPLNLHFGRRPTNISLERYRCIPPGGNRFDLQKIRPDITPQCWLRKKSGGTDLFGRLWWDKPSVTIRTEFFKPEKGRYLHPEQHRPITHREAARLMGFPDEFVFKGSKIEIAKQIGNAVPPPLAFAIAKAVEKLLTFKKRIAA